MQDSFMKRHLIISMVAGVLISILGIYMMFQPESFVKVFISILGLSLVVSGFSSLFALKSFEMGKKTKMVTLFKAILGIIIGLVAIIVPIATASFSWVFLLYLIAAQMVISAVISFFGAMHLRKQTASVSPLLSDGIFSLVIAILLFAFPQQIGTMLIRLVGVVLLAIGLGTVVWSTRIRQINKHFTAAVIEAKAEVVEEP